MAEPDMAVCAPPAREAARYLYVSPRLDGLALFASAALTDTTERHRLVLSTGDPVAVGDVVAEIDRRSDLAGIVIGLTTGLPDRRRLDIVETVLGRGLRAWLYWPTEQAVECVDRERLQSLRRHRQAVIALEKVGRRAHRVMKSWQRVKPGLRWIYRGAFPVRRFDMLADLERLSLDARPVPFRGLEQRPDASRKIDAGL